MLTNIGFDFSAIPVWSQELDQLWVPFSLGLSRILYQKYMINYLSFSEVLTSEELLGMKPTYFHFYVFNIFR